MCKTINGEKNVPPKEKKPSKELADDFFQIIKGTKTWDEETDNLVKKQFKKNPVAVAMMAIGLKGIKQKEEKKESKAEQKKAEEKQKKIEKKVETIINRVKTEYPTLANHLPEMVN